MLSQSGIPVKGNVIVLGKNFSNLIKNLGDKPIVLLLGKKVVPVFVKNFAERSGAQNLFQPGPHRDWGGSPGDRHGAGGRCRDPLLWPKHHRSLLLQQGH